MSSSLALPAIAHTNPDLVPHDFQIGRQDHSRLKGHRSLLMWFTGMSGAGKSCIANRVQADLHQNRLHTCLLDGDRLRQGLTSDLTFDDDGRKENIRRTAEVARLMVDAGAITMVCLISPFEKERRMARALFASDDFIEIFVDAPLAVLERRDPKGLYAKARQGLIKNFTGIDSPYERPTSPDIVINSATTSISQAAELIATFLQQRGLRN